jgi:hypothetical protein
MKIGCSRGEPTSNPSLNRTPNSLLRRLSVAGWLKRYASQFTLGTDWTQGEI